MTNTPVKLQSRAFLITHVGIGLRGQVLEPFVQDGEQRV